MGCDVYEIDGKRVVFSEGDSRFGCLCTFPHNDDKNMAKGRVVGLALLEATVVLARRGYLDNGEYNYIPHEIPKWIVDGICNRLDLIEDYNNGDIWLD